ncbi:RING finger protein 145-like [Lytechinus variegatus]|uniref:RING finger protein 145-like n=1 Tax=Lytechinus variegatus TaxID=7654 RepID=UPI001BB24552|nr:RING finger protein 145-like [Lytechinus variegatus]
MDLGKPNLLRFSNVVLRLPSVFILESLYHSRAKKLIEESDVLNNEVVEKLGVAPEKLTLGAQYVGYLIALLLHALPLHMLFKFYVHMIVGILILASHHLSSHYLALQAQADPASHESIYNTTSSIHQLFMFIGLQTVICVVCSQLLKTRHIWAFAPYLLPLLARACGLSVPFAVVMHAIAEIICMVVVTVFTLRHILVPYRLALIGLQTLQEYVELYGIVSVVLALYNRFFVPAIYLVFWITIFMYQLYSYFANKSHMAVQEKWVLILLASVADCCVSPWSLVGLSFTVSYTAYIVLTFCKVYLKGFSEREQRDFLHRGWTEGVTLMLLAMQTGLLSLKKFEKILLLSIVLFIVISSTIQSIHELTNPVLLSLGASNNRSVGKHVKVLALSFALMCVPLYMSYMVFTIFDMELWLLIIVSSCLLTAIQTLGSVLIYALFMVDHRYETPWESLDDVVYSIQSLCHILEFFLALFVLCYGGLESMNASYNLTGGLVIMVHSYFNVYQRAQAGWNSFMKRRNASRKISHLPKADPAELSSRKDLCPICYEEMHSACITPCKHLFHSICLRKWLYVQEKCPLCHSAIVESNPSGSGDNVSQDQQPTNQEQDSSQPGARGDADSATTESATSSTKVLPSQECPQNATTDSQSESRSVSTVYSREDSNSVSKGVACVSSEDQNCSNSMHSSIPANVPVS